MAADRERGAGVVSVTRGKFIVFEGGEGTGKSTQARLLQMTLARAGCETILTREPGGTANAEAIRALLLQTDGEPWNPRAEALLFAAARSDHTEALIRPALNDGTWIVCDRFVDSSRAYQGAAGGLGDEAIKTLHRFGSGNLLPDLTLLIEVPPDTAAQRLAQRDKGASDAIGGRGAAYHAKVANGFRTICDGEPDRFARINGEGPIDAVQARIAAAVTAALGIAL